MSCGAPEQGGSLDPVAAAGQTVIQGQVLRDAAPVPSAYVRLLDATGEFTAEVVTSANGDFRFFAAPGRWTVRALATGARPAALMIEFSDVEAAAQLIAGHVVRTPTVPSPGLSALLGVPTTVKL